ncbi:putative nucleotidyltransferase with HDIG domain [Kribbella aluminosa]|uniref:Nucleotidyltransferase with HDIG domain n=1 Tax=Kribbella aluminosa TaxID=416017 RepID=A0ABS4UJM9_9ACTN|nr:HD domain-containing protein [Kribbella aluminosa]MBP2351744.1 putative nucleotidyltransferase with HDIG domain [Kribbella aluminosa]
MTTADEARSLARRLLADELPRRWAHTQGVAARARSLAGILGDESELIEVAAFLHDIGYSSEVSFTGFHPLDGARFLRDELAAEEMLCRLVAHHSGALVEAEERGIRELSVEFALPDPGLLDALTYCDLTAAVDGHHVDVEERLHEILIRYPREHVVHRAVVRSGPSLRRAATNVQQRLSA